MSANHVLAPEDDWTQMSDQASKKRAQNRVAQRNYSEPFAIPPARTVILSHDAGYNMKKRIEELERQAKAADNRRSKSTPEPGANVVNINSRHLPPTSDNALQQTTINNSRNVESQTGAQDGIHAVLDTELPSNTPLTRQSRPTSSYSCSPPITIDGRPLSWTTGHIPDVPNPYFTFPWTTAQLQRFYNTTASGLPKRTKDAAFEAIDDEHGYDGMDNSASADLYASCNYWPFPETTFDVSNGVERYRSSDGMERASKTDNISAVVAQPDLSMQSRNVDARTSTDIINDSSRFNVVGVGASSSMIGAVSTSVSSMPDHASNAEQTRNVTNPYSAPTSKPKRKRSVSELSVNTRNTVTPPSVSSVLAQATSRPMNADGSLEDRTNSVLFAARVAGFKSFDDFISTYYLNHFNEASACSDAQRLSRKRHLPAFLQNLRCESESWTHWEAQGYRDETLKSAETILSAESRSFSERPKHPHQAVEALLSFNDFATNSDHASGALRNNNVNIAAPSSKQVAITDPEVADDASSHDFIRMTTAAKRELQNEIPNLWSFLTILTTDAATVVQQENSRLVMALALLITHGNRGSEEDMLKCVDICSELIKRS